MRVAARATVAIAVAIAVGRGVAIPIVAGVGSIVKLGKKKVILAEFDKWYSRVN